jgi:tetratricopeptide (TPR) repeat protein
MARRVALLFFWGRPSTLPSAAVLLVGLLCPPLYANDTPARAVLPAAASAEVANEREALSLRDLAFELFEQQRYAEALPLLERAHALSRAPRHVFNLATAQHWLGHCPSARDNFERYLREEPDGVGAEQARAALDELYQRCGRATVLPQPAPASPTLVRGLRVAAPPPAPVAAAPAREPSVLAWSLIGVGAALGVASVSSLVLVERTEHDVEQRARRAPDDGWTPEARALMKNGDRYATLAAAFGVSALACVSAGVALQLLAPSGAEAVTVSLGRGPLLQYRARF